MLIFNLVPLSTLNFHYHLILSLNYLNTVYYKNLHINENRRVEGTCDRRHRIRQSRKWSVIIWGWTVTAGYAQISPPINNNISMRGRADHRRSPPVLGLICLLEIMEAGTIAPYVIVLLFHAGAVRLSFWVLSLLLRFCITFFHWLHVSFIDIYFSKITTSLLHENNITMFAVKSFYLQLLKVYPSDTSIFLKVYLL